MNETRIVELIVSYFNAYGYYLVFIFLLAENTFLLGLLVPGETVLLLSAFLASAGNLNIVTVVTVGIIAAILGNNGGYFIGREGGRRLIERLGGRWLPPERIEAAEAYFDKHGQKTVFIGRFVAGVRTFVPILAGAARMPYLVFLVYTVASVVLWTIGLGLLGYFFGENRVFLLQVVKRAELAILAAVALAAACFIYRRWKRGRTDES
ncbi:MAG: DedA family protein [Chloroflexi bacterium]|nr:DedA family protein [Chloroflexota bacterium]